MTKDFKRPGLSNGYKWISYLFILLTLIFLVNKLMNFEDYELLVNSWVNFSSDRFGWILLVIALLPLNWLAEALKWQSVTKNTEKLSLVNSFQSVLAGASTGFITPNKLGDLWGRIQFLKTENKEKAWGMFAISSLTQNLAVFIFGLPALLFFPKVSSGTDLQLNEFSVMGMVSLGGLLLFLYILAPELESLINWKWLKKYTQVIGTYTKMNLLNILFKAMLRFVISAVQLYGMLQFFGIETGIMFALIAIPTHYLLVTITPSIAIGEAIVRSSYAVLIFGVVSGNYVNIALAGASLWLLNIVIPVIAGSVFMLVKTNKKNL